MLTDVPTGVWLLSAGYFFIFFGFDPAQNLVTRNFPKFGTISVVALYISFTIATPFIPWVLRQIGPHLTMVIAPIGYTLFTVGTITDTAWLFLFGGICCGASAACLWVAGGRLVALESTENNRGINNGVVFAATRLGSICGNLSAGIIMDKATISLVFLVCCGAICIAHIPMYIYFGRPRINSEEREGQSKHPTVEFSRKTRSRSETRFQIMTNGSIEDELSKHDGISVKKIQEPKVRGTERSSPLALAYAVAMTCVQPKRRYVYLLPLSLLLGLGRGWIVAMIPPRVDSSSAVGYIRAVFSFVSAIGAMIWGRVYDWRAKKKPSTITHNLLFFILLLSVSTIVAELLPFSFPKNERLPWFYFVNIIFACFTSGLWTVENALLASFCGDDQVNVFASHYVVHAIGWVIVFSISYGTGVDGSFILAIVMVTISLLGIVTVYRWPGPKGNEASVPRE